MNGDAVAAAILRFKPSGKILCAFARVTGRTTTDDVIPRHNPGVVDDVLPGWTLASRDSTRNKLDAAIDAAPIPFNHFGLK